MQCQQSPQRILFVGNETQVDIVGGNAMGWRTALIRGTELSSHGLAHYDCDSCYHLLRILTESAN